jgi:cell filamentation protein
MTKNNKSKIIERDLIDPYSYKSDNERKTLINKFGIKDFEEAQQKQREISKKNYSKIKTVKFTPEGFKNIHKELFDEMYDWAGKSRNVNISGETALFAQAEFIEQSLNYEFQQISENIKNKEYFNDKQWIQKAADHFGELITIHPFRDGNGRTTRKFTDLFLKEKGLIIDWREMDREAYYEASRDTIMKADSTKMVKLFEISIQKEKNE